jgi:EmrB/QacA subfamily drug resistance transporter
MEKTQSRQTVLLVTTIGSFLTTFMGSAIIVGLPAIGDELNMDAIALSWVATVYLLAATIVLVPIGRIADMFGRKRIFTYGIFTYTVTSILLALSTSSTMLISLRVLQGIGGAMIFATSLAILTSAYPPGERGKVLGINAAVINGGLSSGPFVGGILTQYLGWRSIFWINVPLTLLIIGLIFWKLKGEWVEASGEKFDIFGSVIYAVTITAIMYGLTTLPKISGGILIFAGLLGIVGFARWESRTMYPLLDIGVFRNNTVFTLSNLAALLSLSGTFAVAFLLSLYLQYIKGLTPQNAGVVLLVTPLMQAIFAPFAGRLSDKIEPGIVASAGMGLTVIGLTMFIFLNAATSLWFIITGLLTVGVGTAFFSTPNINLVMGSVHHRSYGSASATMVTMRQMGMMLSMAIVMMLISLYVGGVEITPEHYAGFVKSVDVAFIVFSALCFVGIFASLARGKLR